MASDFEQLIDEEIRQLQAVKDEEIQQLQALKKMASKPRMVALMREIVVCANGTAVAPQQPPPPAPSPAGQKIISHGDLPVHKSAPNGLTAAVLAAVRSFDGRFRVHDVERKMLDAGFPFVAKDRRVAISGVLERMVKDTHTAKLVHKGKGGKPNVYEYTGD
jgi:hypothetical protein